MRYFSTQKVALAVMVLLCSSPPFLHADDESDRKRYLDEIDGLLDGISSDLDRVPGDSSPSYVDAASRKLDELKDKARRLYDLRGSDDRAKKYAEAYPGYADKLRESLNGLRQLKEKHRELDALPRLCEDKQRELAERTRRYTDTNNPDGLEAIPAIGRELGKPIRETLEQAERRKSEVEAWRGRARQFTEGDGKWSNVRGELHDAADAAHDVWKRAWEQSKHACEALAKEERNLAIEAALRLLTEGEKVRQEIYRELETQLRAAATAIDDLERDSNDSDVDAAVRAAEGIRAQLEKLSAAKGSDRKANEVAKDWPRHHSALVEALVKLRVLKQGQFIIDKAPATCKDAQDRLSETIKPILDARDHDERDKIPLIARNLGKSIEEKLQLAAQQDATMRAARDAARAFAVSEGAWQALSTNFKESTDAIFKYWEDALVVARNACTELAKGEGHKDVVAALKRLDDSHSLTENEIARVDADVQRWYTQVRELRGWYKQDTKSVRDMFCSLEESPGDSELGGAYIAKLEEIVNRMQSRLAPRWNELMKESQRILALLEDLKKAPERIVRGKSYGLFGRLNESIQALINLMNDELKGANDPEFRMTVEVGKNEHKRIQADSSKCDASEITIPGARARMDCVKVNSGICTIVEIKPSNDAAIAKGRKQLVSYQSAMAAYHEAHRDRVKDAFDGELKVFQRCIANGEISLRTEVRAYDLCPPEGMLFRDFVVAE